MKVVDTAAAIIAANVGVEHAWSTSPPDLTSSFGTKTLPPSIAPTGAGPACRPACSAWRCCCRPTRGYGSGENRERFAQAGIELQAKVPRLNNGEYFTKEDFQIDLQAMTCRCPADQLTNRLVRAGVHHQRSGKVIPLRAFQFSAKVCGVCPVRARCFKPSDHGRLVRLHPQEAMMQAAKEWQRSPGFDLFRKRRQVVEHRLARLVQLGVRQARDFGRRKTLFQALMVAAVANLTLVLSKTGNLGYPTGPDRGAQGVRSGVFKALMRPLQAAGRYLSVLSRSLALSSISGPHPFARPH